MMTKTPDPVDEAVADAAMPRASRWSVRRIMGAAAGVGAIAFGVAAVLFPRDGAETGKKDERG